MKKILCLCLALILGTAAYASPAIVHYGTGDSYTHYSIMLDESGKLLTPREAYGNIYSISIAVNGDYPEFYAAAQSVIETPLTGVDSFPFTPIALMNDKGELLTGFDYASLTHYPEEGIVIFAGENNIQGAMDESGNIILPAGYISLVPNGQGGFLGCAYPEGSAVDYETAYPVIYIDEKGRTYETGYSAMPYGLRNFSEGFCSVTMNYEENSSGNVYLDFEGTNVFGRTYGWTEPFYGNYASVYDPSSGMYGLIDKTGAWAQPPEYTTIDSGYYYDTDAYLACTDKYAYLLDKYDLHEICRIDLAATGANYAWQSGKDFITAMGNDVTCIFSSDGTLVARGVNVDTMYTHTDSQPERLVRTEGEWPNYTCTLTDLEGNTYGPGFQGLTPATWQSGEGRYVFSSFDYTTDTDGQRVPDWSSYRFGLCDQEGNILLDPIYTTLDPLFHNRYWVRLGSRTGMIDDTGAWLYAINDYEYLMD